LRALVLAAAALSISCARGAPAVDPAAVRKAAALTEEAYALKRDGRNGAALARLAQAAPLLPQDGRDFASNLDDRATLELRMGRADEAMRLYDRALSILRASSPVDERLIAGVSFRRRIVDALATAGVTCAEPREPRPDAALPYFPAIDAVQRELGRIGPSIAGCLAGPAKPVTVTLVGTGDGRIALAETPGALAGTPAETCVRRGAAGFATSLALPRFGACFRPFNVPFRIGKES
jgi:tetratricopeptide (TPR) repeat protein